MEDIKKENAHAKADVIKSFNKDSDNSDITPKEPQIISEIIDKVKDDPESLLYYLLKQGGKK